MTDSPSAVLLLRFDLLDRHLQLHGFPATSPWWHATVRRFYESGCRQLVLRAGRRAGKSSTLTRLAVVEALWGTHHIPPGDIGVVAFISTTRDEATQRLRTIEAILDTLEEKYRRSGDAIELIERRIVFKVFPANIAGVSGFTCICAICDEVAKWRDVDTGANPASEVLASLRPTMATQPSARIILSSSPLGILDAHHDAFEAGDSSFQVTAHATSWEANPTLTEQGTRELEPDEATWSREYAAIPQAEAESSLYTAHEVDLAMRADPLTLGPEHGHFYQAAMDPATRKDAWTVVVATMRVTSAGLLQRSVVLAREWRGTRAVPLSPKAVLSEIALLLRPYDLDSVFTDQASGDALRDIGATLKPELFLVVEPTTATSRVSMYENLKTRLENGEVELPPDPQIKADLLGVRKRITRAGVTLELPRMGGRHCDYAPAIALVMSKHFDEPPQRLAGVNAAEAGKQRRLRAHIAKQERPWWQQQAPTDRGPGADWRR